MVKSFVDSACVNFAAKAAGKEGIFLLAGCARQQKKHLQSATLVAKPAAITLTHVIAKKCPVASNFYMIGMWVKGFGVPMAAASGKEVIQQICKADSKKF